MDVLLTNVGDKEVVIRAGTRIGTVQPFQCKEASGIPEVSQVDLVSDEEYERDMDLQSPKYKEKHKFIVDNLKLDANMDASMKDRFIRLFVRFFDAVSTGGDDLGHTKLGECKIELKPDAKPFKSAVRPLNPAQIADLKRQIREWSDS